MEIDRHRGMMANEHTRIGSNSYEKAEYLGSLSKNQNSNHDKIKCRIKEGNSCYYSVQIFPYSRFLSKNL